MAKDVVVSKKEWYEANKETQRTRAKERTARRVAAGLCAWGTCPNLAVSGQQLCEKHRDRGRQSRRRSKYGLTYLEVLALEELEHCEVCGGSQRLCIDHNHRTGRVRGVLCHNCNTALGHVGDSPGRLRALARYLEDRDE